MICDPCKEGGSLLQNALAVTGKVKDVLMSAAEASHKKCPDRTCPCQHKLEEIRK